MTAGSTTARDVATKPAVPTFHELFGRAPELTGDAHGRANLIGEHTDYNGGFVLPIAIPQRTVVELARRRDDTVHVASEEVPAEGVVHYALGEERRGRGWADYVQGITRALGQAGHTLHGFDARIASRVPVGSGVSSSAALGVALGRALRAAFELRLDDVALARAVQRAENEFVGARVGIMDPMAAALAGERSALFLDTRTLVFEIVPLPETCEVVVIHSGIRHAHAAGDYNRRRAECERASELLGVRELRDVSPDDLARAERLPEPLGRRVRHVVTENARVLDAVSAIRAGDVAELGRLLDTGHASLRDDYEVSLPEIDLLVTLAREQPGALGARLTGGGFGGSIVALVMRGRGSAVAAAAARSYAQRSGRTPTVLVPCS